ncbi:MAG TPA: AAA family ATPase [Thermoleophilaceae bacterium]|jgi:uncharacterized protein YhaN
MSLRLATLELRAFGPFTGTVIDISGGGDGDLHVITGPNEAGKSTSRRAFGDLLFGIPVNTTDNHVHANPDLRLAATLIDKDGKELTVVRRKGRTNTLTDDQGRELDDDVLDGLLGSISRETFEAMFSLDHDTLVDGGKALLDADGELGESLFSASMGATALHELRCALQEQADCLFRPRASSTKILHARAVYDAKAKEINSRTLRANAFKSTQREAERIAGEITRLRNLVATLRADNAVRERLCVVHPLLIRRRALLDELEKLGDVPVLDAAAAGCRRSAEATEKTQNELASIAELRAAKLQETISGIDVDETLVAHEAAITALHGRVANIAEAEEDLSEQEGKLRSARATATRTLKAIRHDLDLDGADQLHLTEARRAEISDMLDEHSALTATFENATETANGAEIEAADAQRDLDGSPVPPDTGALQDAVAAAHAAGDIERQITAAAVEVAEAETQRDQALAKLSPTMSLRMLGDVRPPTAAAVAAFAEQADEIASRDRDLTRGRDELEAAERSLSEDEDRLRSSGDGDVATVEDLAGARAQRDNAWSHVRRRLDGDDTAPVQAEQFEQQIRDADGIADQLRDKAGAAERRAELGVRRRRYERDTTALTVKQTQLDSDRSEHERSWLQAWEPCGIKPAAPAVMTGWLGVRETVLAHEHTAQRRREAQARLEADRDRHVATLRAELAALGDEGPASAGITELIARTKRLCESSATAATNRRDLQTTVRSAQVTASRQRETAETARRELEGWDGRWRELTTAAGWTPDVTAASGRRMLELVRDLFTQLDAVATQTTRVEGIRARIESFNTEAEQIAQEIAPELGTLRPMDVVGQLSRRLKEALEASGRRTTLTGELEDARTEIDEARSAATVAVRELKGLCERAGVADVSALEAAERDTQRRAELRDQVAALEADIRGAGHGTVEALAEQVEQADIDQLRAQSEAVVREIEDHDEPLTELTTKAGELRRERDQMNIDGGAASSAEDLEGHVSEMRELTERYLKAWLAAFALTQAIDRYRTEHKTPLLARANELFPVLTEGRFAALEVNFDDKDRPVLIGVRSSGERLTVSQMSTGTREQLYLALRIASLERHVDQHGPMPVIFDDVVLHSDPGRKKAILAALGELAKVTQVIAFTHDPVVVELARVAVPDTVLTIHELGSNDIADALHPNVAPADVRPLRTAA